MVTCKGYSIYQDVQNNKIVITLPQTYRTLVSTDSEPVNRRLQVSPGEEAILLAVVMEMFKLEDNAKGESL